MRQQKQQSNQHEPSVFVPEFDNRVIAADLDRYLTKHYWLQLTDWQRAKPRTYLHDGNKLGARITAIRIDADGDRPGVLVRTEDLALDQQPVTGEQMAPPSFADRYKNFNEAAAVTEILNRRDVP